MILLVKLLVKLKFPIRVFHSAQVEENMDSFQAPNTEQTARD
jgi:hypothetical protein